MIFCSQCGKQLNDEAKFCSACGAEQSKSTSPQNEEKNTSQNITPEPTQATQQFQASQPTQAAQGTVRTDRKLRQGFTSFWLWLVFIFNLIALVATAIIWFTYDDLRFILFDIYYFIPQQQTFLWSGICYGVTCIGLWRVLRDWVKDGFYTFIGGYIGNIFVTYNFFDEESFILSVIGGIIVIGISFAVLHIRNSYNALTTWEQLK